MFQLLSSGWPTAAAAWPGWWPARCWLLVWMVSTLDSTTPDSAARPWPPPSAEPPVEWQLTPAVITGLLDTETIRFISGTPGTLTNLSWVWSRRDMCTGINQSEDKQILTNHNAGLLGVPLDLDCWLVLPEIHLKFSCMISCPGPWVMRWDFNQSELRSQSYQPIRIKKSLLSTNQSKEHNLVNQSHCRMESRVCRTGQWSRVRRLVTCRGSAGTHQRRTRCWCLVTMAGSLVGRWVTTIQ